MKTLAAAFSVSFLETLSTQLVSTIRSAAFESLQPPKIDTPDPEEKDIQVEVKPEQKKTIETEEKEIKENRTQVNNDKTYKSEVIELLRKISFGTNMDTGVMPVFTGGVIYDSWAENNASAYNGKQQGASRSSTNLL